MIVMKNKYHEYIIIYLSVAIGCFAIGLIVRATVVAQGVDAFIYNTLNYSSPNPGMDIIVSYDNELGLILKPITEEEDDTTEGGESGKGKKGKTYHYNILAIIEALNQHEADKEKIIHEWKEKIDVLFDYLKITGDLTAKMNSSELFDREQLHGEFKKTVRKYIRVHKLDAFEKAFYEDNLEQLFEDFDEYLHPQVETTEINMYEIRGEMRMIAAENGKREEVDNESE